MRFSRSASHCAIKLVKHVPSWEGTKHSSTRKFTEEMNFLTLNTFSFVPCCPVRRPHLLPVIQVGTRARCPAVLAQARQEYEHQKFFSESEIDYISSLQNSTGRNAQFKFVKPFHHHHWIQHPAHVLQSSIAWGFGCRGHIVKCSRRFYWWEMSW